MQGQRRNERGSVRSLFYLIYRGGKGVIIGLTTLTSISGICEGVQERGDTKYKGGGNGDVVLYGRIVPTYPPSKTPVEDCERGPLLDITFTKVDGKDISRKFQVGGAVNLRKL